MALEYFKIRMRSPILEKCLEQTVRTGEVRRQEGALRPRRGLSGKFRPETARPSEYEYEMCTHDRKR